MFRKALTLLLTLALLLACLSPAVATVATDEVQELTMAVVRRPQFDSSESFNDKEIFQRIEGITGIHVNFLELPEFDFDTQVALLLAGDLPDVFYSFISDHYIVENPSLFVPIQDLLEENCPNIMALYADLDVDWRAYLTYPDGNIYGLMDGYLRNPVGSPAAAQWVNIDWLDRLGLGIPTTGEEFYEMLVAFKEQDADGDGDPNNEIPLEFCESYYGTLYNYAAMWGLPLSRSTHYNIVDGEVVEAVNTPAYREFLEFFHKLNEEGLMNVEGFSFTREQYNSSLSAGNVGTYYHWLAETAYQDQDFIHMFVNIPPIAMEGYTPVIKPENGISANRNGFVITTACKDPAVALRWYDTISENDLAHELARYREGFFWNYNEEGYMVGRAPSAEELTAEWGDPNANLSSYTYNMCHPLIVRGIVGDPEQPWSGNWLRYDACTKAAPFQRAYMSQAIVTAEQSEELTFMTDGLSDYINAYVADAVLNGVTDGSWDAYVTGLENYGYSFYIEWYNNYLHGTL